jgi:hypothetical protein
LFTLDPLGAEIGDFADTASIIAQLDLVVAIDTSIVHLYNSGGDGFAGVDAAVEVGARLAPSPLTDPDVRLSRIRLLPRS